MWLLLIIFRLLLLILIKHQNYSRQCATFMEIKKINLMHQNNLKFVFVNYFIKNNSNTIYKRIYNWIIIMNIWLPTLVPSINSKFNTLKWTLTMIHLMLFLYMGARIFMDLHEAFLMTKISLYIFNSLYFV